MITRSIKLINLNRSISVARRFASSGFATDRQHHRPELDFDYLLDPSNIDAIRTNVTNRKQTGDIDRVHRLWTRLEEFLGDRRYATDAAPVRPMELKSMWDEFYDACFALPNRTHPDAPLGDESNARMIEIVGERSRMMEEFRPLTAEQIAVMLRAIRSGTMEVSTAAGDKAYFLYDQVSILERALIEYSLEIVRRHGFRLIHVPDVLNVDVPRKCGLTSRTEMNIVYNVKNRSDYCLSGTGEMGVASYLENRLFDRGEVWPKKFVTVSRCYRPEVARGKISRGLYRVHEFTKVEMFAVTKDDVEESERMLREFVDVQREICDGLELHYKILDMPTKELGAPAYRKFDIEAWMPGRNIYGEISSASNCTDYQSRRLRTKYRTEEGDFRFVHTVNGTACAASRMLIAFMEQHQKKNKLVMIPKALKLYFNDWPALYPSRTQLKMQAQNPRLFRKDDESAEKS